MYIISGTKKNQRIICPEGLHTRPTSSRLRQTLFNMCQSYIEGVRFLDLFAGSGAMGLEALSRGAAYATFIDNDVESVRCIRENLLNMKWQNQGKVLSANVFTWLDKSQQNVPAFDLIYADPPYDAETTDQNQPIKFSEKLLNFVDAGHLLAPHGTLFIEDSTRFQPRTEALKSLVFISERRSGRSTLREFRRLTN